MESSSMHGQFTIGEWLSSTLFLGLMNLEADLSFRLSLVVNLQAIVTLLAIPLITVSSSWQGTCLKVESVIPLGSPSVCKNSVGESMLHGVSVYHSLIPLTVTDGTSWGIFLPLSSKRSDHVHTIDLNKQGSGNRFQVPNSRSTSRLEYRPVSKIQYLVSVSNAFATIHQDIMV
ncbi:hypothetical protein QYF36_016622 [Acer negundo]|nr:hypothetical protein QYF36_016622 [Acer negundo]